MLDIDQLKSDLETYINNLSSASEIEDMMLVVSALNSLTVDRIPSVATVNDLPDLSLDNRYLPDGSIFFVDSIKTLVYNIGNYWKGIDTRVLRYDGPPLLTTLSWGNNANGRLGDNTATLTRSSPVTVVGGITNWTQVSAGGSHSLGITESGVLYAWGNNSFGELGDNTITSRSSPITPLGGITNWSQVSAGTSHSLGLTDTGVLYAWGRNDSGQLGNNTNISRSSPVTVVGGITNWSQVAAGSSHSLGLTETGVLYAWGLNNNYQLGININTDRSSPVTVLGGITNWTQVSGGGSHSLGIAGGIAYAWGAGSTGQLGNLSTLARGSPVTVVGGITNWTQVSAGLNHSFGITETGVLYAWGSGQYGKTGIGTYFNQSSPVTVVGGITNWSQVSASKNSSHSLGLTDTGVLYAWGRNNAGQLGDDTTTSRSSPVTVVGGITNWSQIGAGSEHSLGAFTT
jgi:alpha-tubulin suppressor-like RCC1 family protein